MSQVRTFIEMDSHEERVYAAVRQTQEKEAKQKMREKAKELSKLQRTQQLNKNLNSATSMQSSSMQMSASSNEFTRDSSVNEKPIRETNMSSHARPKVCLELYNLTTILNFIRYIFRDLQKH